MSAARAPKPPTRRINRGNGHSYLLDGEKVPGVTTLLNGIPKDLAKWGASQVTDYVLNRLELKDGHVVADELLDDLRAAAAAKAKPTTIPDWRGKPRLGAILSKIEWEMNGLPYASRDTAALKGTKVHKLAQQLAEGETVEVPPEHVGYAQAYLKFRDDWLPEEELVEFTVVSRRFRYMGTGDLLCRLGARPDLGRCLIDIKTGAKGPYESTGLQLAGYRFADSIVDEDGEEAPMPHVDSTFCLWLRHDGYDLIPFLAEDPELRMLLYAGQIKAFMEANNYRGDDPPAWVDPATARRLKGDALAPPRRDAR